MKSSLINMVLTLPVITLVAAKALGFLYNLTKKLTKAAQAAQTTAANSQGLPV